MVALNKIYTRTGDDGTTALGSGRRVSKYDLRVEAYGTLDETNAAIGLARLCTRGKHEGLDAMNPAPVMELVEMIRGIATDDATFGRTKEFVETLGKTVAVSEDFPAFMHYSSQ